MTRAQELAVYQLGYAGIPRDEAIAIISGLAFPSDTE